MKTLKTLWENKFTIICFIAGYVMGFCLFKFLFICYENEVLTNLILKTEVLEYINQETECD